MINNAAVMPDPVAGHEVPSETVGIAGESEPRPLGLWSVCGLSLVVGAGHRVRRGVFPRADRPAP